MKRNISRFISLILVFSLVISLLSGCGGNDSANKSKDEFKPGLLSSNTIGQINDAESDLKDNGIKEDNLLNDLYKNINNESYSDADGLLSDLVAVIESDSDIYDELADYEETAKEEVIEGLSSKSGELLQNRIKTYNESLSGKETELEDAIHKLRESINNKDRENSLLYLYEVRSYLNPKEENVLGVNDVVSIKEESGINNYTLNKLNPEDFGYLEITPAMELSDDIKETAELLGSPLEIYNYVKNTVDFSNYSGLRKGATATFDSNVGNDVDQATLLIAMFRYMGYPACYKSGVIKLDKETALNITGADNLKSAADILAAMGENTTLVSVKGVPSYIKKVHTWVSAYVPYTDYRSSGPADGKSIWVDLDTSIKEYQDSISLLDAFEENYSLDYSSLDELNKEDSVAALDNGLNDFCENVDQYYRGLADSDNVISSKNRCIVPTHEEYLPLSLQYEVISESGTSYSLDDTSDSISFAFDDDDDISFRYYDLYNKRLTIEYKGATDSDDEILAAYGGVFNTPAYSVYVVPTLLLDGEEVLRGSEVTLGETQHISITINSGSTVQSTTNNIISGSMYSLVIDPQTITINQALSLKDEINNAKSSILTRWDQLYNEVDYDEDDYYEIDSAEEEKWAYGFYDDSEMGVFLQETGLYYFSQLDEHIMFMSEANDVYANRYLSLGTTGYEVGVNYRYGVPNSLTYGNYLTDIDFNHLSAVSLGDDENAKDFMLQIGMISSQLESDIWRELTGFDAVSTVDILSEAYESGIEVVALNSSNVNNYIDKACTSDSSKKDIYNSISQGREVYIPETPVEIYGQKWTGYIVLDTESYTGRYMISGGLSGSETVNLDDIDMDMVKAESDLYLNATTFGSAVIVAAALVGISVYGDTSLGATLSYLLMEFEASINILKTEYERYKQNKLYQEYLDGNEESGIEFYNNTRSEQVKTACIALGYLADLVFMSADGLITKKLEEKTAQKALEKNAADEATEQLLKEQDEWAIQYAEIEAIRETEKKAAENAGKEFVEDASKETAEELVDKTVTDTNITLSEKIIEENTVVIHHKATSGVELKSTPGKTTTILGRYNSDTGSIIKELDIKKSVDFSGNTGGFNLLNTPDELYISAEQFWEEYNKPFLDAAIERNDVIIMATPITNDNLYVKGTTELTGYGREYYYLLKKGYKYIDGKMIP